MKCPIPIDQCRRGLAQRDRIDSAYHHAMCTVIGGSRNAALEIRQRIREMRRAARTFTPFAMIEARFAWHTGHPAEYARQSFMIMTKQIDREAGTRCKPLREWRTQVHAHQ